MRYITFEDLPEIPVDVALCPICGAPIEITDIDEWETETMRVTETGLHINCTTQPHIDSDEWWQWHKWHWSQPYVYWLPVEARVYRWFDSCFRLTVVFRRRGG